ncbi:unnamed protein product [Cylindrotheca closterium]|uniref:Uncharacterized protein n=1 Tax=Cylindrotheca closterium TaxID=2856 RepID=A0AAD2CA86_9STRA|nr:unnamed protein product [Cylindrotheca closterium]
MIIQRQFHATSMASDKGDEFYQKAMELIEKSRRDEDQREQERSKKMYEAWQKSEEASRTPKSQGVAVVKTLVKETRKAKKATPEDLKEQALDLLEQAATEHQHPMALVQLGNLRLQKAGKEESEDAAEALVQQAADMFRLAGEGGSRVGWYNLGNLYWTGYPVADDEYDLDEVDETEDGDLPPDRTSEKIFKPDLHEAMEAFMNAIDLGDTDAMYLVGVHRMTSGGRENIYSGLNMVQKAADEGHAGALYYLALLNLNGEPNIGLEPCSLETFVELLDKAVEAGSTDAMFTRGHSFFHGSEGYPEDRKRALEDFIVAAESGHADSAVSAGAILHGGIGVPKDQKRAFDLYQMAGELGSKEGWQNVVACYSTGEGVAQSTKMAEYIKDTMLKDI